MQELCKNCGKPISQNWDIWFHIETASAKCHLYAEPLPPKPTRQERQHGDRLTGRPVTCSSNRRRMMV
jgi:hypothetical protein